MKLLKIQKKSIFQNIFLKLRIFLVLFNVLVKMFKQNVVFDFT